MRWRLGEQGGSFIDKVYSAEARLTTGPGVKRSRGTTWVCVGITNLTSKMAQGVGEDVPVATPAEDPPKKFPKGVVLGKDGKP